MLNVLVIRCAPLWHVASLMHHIRSWDDDMHVDIIAQKADVTSVMSLAVRHMYFYDQTCFRGEALIERFGEDFFRQYDRIVIPYNNHSGRGYRSLHRFCRRSCPQGTFVFPLGGRLKKYHPSRQILHTMGQGLLYLCVDLPIMLGMLAAVMLRRARRKNPVPFRQRQDHVSYDQVVKVRGWSDVTDFRIQNKSRRDALLDLLDIQEHERVLDVACNIGDFSIEIAAQTGAKTVGVDFCFSSLKKASHLSHTAHGSGHFLRCDATELPFFSQKFDTVILAEIMEHFEDPQRLLSEAKRVMKKNGVLAITVPNVASCRGRHRLFRNGSFLDGWIEHRRHYSLETVIVELEKNGLAVERVIGNIVDVPGLAWLKRIMPHPFCVWARYCPQWSENLILLTRRVPLKSVTPVSQPSISQPSLAMSVS